MTSAEVPPSDDSVSGRPTEDRPESSVLDFLYHDARRVGSFLSQFETYGVPSQVKAAESSGQAQSRRLSGSAGMDALTFAKAQLSYEVTTSDDERDTAERTYDPLWANARALLRYLQAHDLIERDLWAARLGRFVIATGHLVVLDFAMLKAAWDKPTVKQFVRQGARTNAAPSPKGHGKAHGNQQAEVQLFMELLTLFPHALQGHIVGGDYIAWFGLAEGSLVGMSSDIVLKHGTYVPGAWSVLGVLDATPDSAADGVPELGTLAPLDAAVAEHAGTVIGALTAQITPLARQLLGRPRNAFGLTPLLIFREVSG